MRHRSRSRSRLDYLIIFLFTNSQNYFLVLNTNKTAPSASRLHVVEDAGIELRTVAELVLTSCLPIGHISVVVNFYLFIKLSRIIII